MKAAALILAGLVTSVAGGVIRTCEQTLRADMAADLASAFCLPGTVHSAASLAHQHCVGCFMIVAGVALMLSALLARRQPVLRRAVERASP